MLKLKTIIIALLLCVVTSFPAFAGEAYITSYAFADVAGDINGTDITVNVPYSTTTTYWNHKVQVSEGATFTAGMIGQVGDDAEGKIKVVSADGDVKEYTVHIKRNAYKEPTISISKASSIKKNSAKVTVSVNKNDAEIRSLRVVYYTEKNSLSYVQCDKDLSEQDVEIKGLAEDTKYRYYLELETPNKTYTSGTRNFTTKKSSDTGTSTSSSSSNNTSNNRNNSTATTGPGNGAKQNTTYANQWVEENGKWVYYGPDGVSKTGWFEVGGKWYYVTKGTNELAVNQWKLINDVYYHFDASGAMSENAWVESSGKWYFVGPGGTMLHSQMIQVDGVIYSLTPDGYCLSDSWVLEGTRWRYYKPDSKGLARNETFECDGVVYTADADGYVV